MHPPVTPHPNLFRYDVAVVGAGPAGAAAAIEAAGLGLRVAIVEEQAVAGGQIYRVVPGIAPVRSDPERTEGDKVRAQLGAANIVRYFEHRVWHIERFDGLWHLQPAAPAARVPCRPRRSSLPAVRRSATSRSPVGNVQG